MKILNPIPFLGVTLIFAIIFKIIDVLMHFYGVNFLDDTSKFLVLIFLITTPYLTKYFANRMYGRVVVFGVFYYVFVAFLFIPEIISIVAAM